MKSTFVICLFATAWLLALATPGGAASLTWNTGSGTWDVGASANWDPGATVFANGDSVLFTNRGADATVTVTAGGVQPAQIAVSNNANTYTFSGGAISSTGSLTKSGSGHLTLATDNTGIAGGLSIGGSGISRFTASTALGAAGSVQVALNSSVDIAFNNFGGSAAAGDLARVSAMSSGTVALAGTSYASAIDLTGYRPSLRLAGSYWGVGGGNTLSGTLTPQGETYEFGAGGGGLAVATALADGLASRGLMANGQGLSRSGCNTTTYSLTRTNTYTGVTRIRDAYLRLAGPMGCATGSGVFSVERDGLLGLDPGLRVFGWGDDASVAFGNHNDRIGDDKEVRLRGGTFFFYGNGNTGTAEAIGRLNVQGGHSIVDVRYNSYNPYVGDVDSSTFWVRMNNFSFMQHSALSGNLSAELTFGQLLRDGNNGHLLVRGQNLGAPGATGASRITFTNAPALVGGGGGAGSTTISLLPYAYSGGNGNSGNSLVTHDANGLRALNTGTELAALAVGVSNDNNVIINDSTNVTHTISADTTMNSLFLACSGQSTTVNSSGGGKLILKSGVLMLQIQAPTDGGTWTMSAPVDFNGREGNIFYFGRSFYAANNNAVYSNTGTNGLTITDVIGIYVQPMYLGGSSTYGGPTTINRGTVQTTASEVIPDASDLRVRHGAQLVVGNGRTETVASLAGNGTVTLETGSSRLLVGSGSTAAGAAILNGAGAMLAPGDGYPGTLTVNGAAEVRLRGGEFRVDVDGPVAFDVLSVTNGTSPAVTLSDPGNGFAGARLVLSLNHAPTLGDGYRIVDVAGSTAVSGKFSNGDLIKGYFGSRTYLFDILYNSSLAGGDGNDIVLRASAIVGGTVFVVR